MAKKIAARTGIKSYEAASVIHAIADIVAEETLNAANGKSRLGCTVAAKFSRQFSDEVSWQKVDPQAAAAASGEEDITEGGDNNGGNGGGGNNPPGELEE